MNTNHEELAEAKNWVSNNWKNIAAVAVMGLLTTGCVPEADLIKFGIDPKVYYCGLCLVVPIGGRLGYLMLKSFFNGGPDRQSRATHNFSTNVPGGFQAKYDGSGDRGGAGDGPEYGRGNVPGSGVNQTTGPDQGSSGKHSGSKTDNTYNAHGGQDTFTGPGPGDAPPKGNPQAWNGNMGETTAFNVLNLQRNASPEQIQQAYREAARNSHPDRGGSTEVMQRTNRANDVLHGKK
jgi:hypothetical protein